MSNAITNFDLTSPNSLYFGIDNLSIVICILLIQLIDKPVKFIEVMEYIRVVSELTSDNKVYPFGIIAYNNNI